MFVYKFISVFFISSLLAVSAHAQPNGQWKELLPMSSKRTEVAVAVLDNNIYVVGGFTQKGITDQVEAWNSEIREWSNIPPLPRPIHHSFSHQWETIRNRWVRSWHLDTC